MAVKVSDPKPVVFHRHIRTNRQRDQEKTERPLLSDADLLDFCVGAESQVRRSIRVGARLNGSSVDRRRQRDREQESGCSATER